MAYYSRVLSKDEEFPAFEELAELLRAGHPDYRLTVESGEDDEWESLLLASRVFGMARMSAGTARGSPIARNANPNRRSALSSVVRSSSALSCGTASRPTATSSRISKHHNSSSSTV